MVADAGLLTKGIRKNQKIWKDNIYVRIMGKETKKVTWKRASQLY
jgi:hypothetical protein